MLGFNDTSTLEGHLCRLPEKGRKVIEEIVEEIKERDREHVSHFLASFQVL